MVRPYKSDDLLGLTLRVLDVPLRPLGINFASFRPNPPATPGEGRQEVFDDVYRDNTWKSSESRSGTGSTVAYTNVYRQALAAFLKEFRITSMFDAPCGDLNWMPQVLRETSVRYIGGDVSEEVVTLARNRHPELDIRKFDICEDKFPSAQVWHCRDCLFHLSYADIRLALHGFVRSDIDYALLTTHKARVLNNVDIATGDFRWLDMQKPPFSFPHPAHYIKDYRPRRDFPRFVGVWTRSQIAAALA